MLFSDLKLDPNLMRGIQEAGFTQCTPVQEETFTHTLLGKDVSVQSQTGTGKTAAFLISLFQMMSSDKDGGPDRALIVAPTRELATQIEEEARMLGIYMPFTTGAFYGGTGYGRQEQMLRSGVDIMVATPGRLLDFASQGKVNLGAIGYLVIDEADRLFDMGFLPDLRRILRRMRPAAQRQTMLFSATLSYTVRRLASEHMNEPVEIEITPEKVTVENVTQELYHVGSSEKMNLLLGLLKRESPANCLLFVNMKSTAEELARRLLVNGVQCEYLSGDLPQARRQQTIDRFKQGEIPLLIATDVASRGLHVDELELVINFDLPENSENYVHRIGRTARAGKSGKAISLACEHFVDALPPIEKLIGMRIPVMHADDELYIEDKSGGRGFYVGGGWRGGDRGGRGRPGRGSGGPRRSEGRPQRGSGRPGGGHSHTERHRSRESQQRTPTAAASGHRAESGRAQMSARPRSGADHSATPRQSRSQEQMPHSPKVNKPRPSLFRKIAGLFR